MKALTPVVKLIILIIAIIAIAGAVILVSQTTPDTPLNPSDPDDTTNTTTPDPTYYVLTLNSAENGTLIKSPNQPRYINASKVTITPQPDYGYYLDHWEINGVDSGNEIPLTITMDENKTITAFFKEGGYHIELHIEGEGRVWLNNIPYDPDTLYPPGSSVRIIASPQYNGYSFSHWEMDLTGSENEASLLMDANKIITAVFVESQSQFTITTKTTGEGTISIDPQYNYYSYGENVTIEAIPSNGWEFVRWRGTQSSDTTSNPLTIEMLFNYTITAEFTEKEYTINITKEGSGSVDLEPHRTTYSYDDEVTLTATPSSEWILNYWKESDGVTSSENPHIIRVGENNDITVNFTRYNEGYSLGLFKTPTNVTATIERTPEQNRYSPGTQVILTATDNSNWTFSHWSGDLNNTEQTTAILMDSSKSVTANYLTFGYRLTTNTIGDGEIVTTPSQSSYANGTQVALKANSADGWTFSHWSGDLNTSANPTYILMDSAKNITAHFIQKSYNLTIISHGNGSTTPNGTNTYPSGEQITIDAQPEAGYVFSYWQDEADTYVTPSPTITLNDDKILHFYFVDVNTSHTLNITIDGEGEVQITPNKLYYGYNENVELSAQGSDDWAFVSWSGDLSSTNKNITISMDDDKNITAHFYPGMELTISIEGSGHTTPYDQGTTVLPYNTAVNLTALADEGWLFSHWSGDINDSTNPLQFCMDSSKNITAHFERKTYHLNLTIQGEGNVSISPEQSFYSHGTEVTLTALEGPGSFCDWSGDLSTTQKIVTITLNSNKNITAHFATPHIMASGSIALNDIEPGETVNTTIQVTNDGETGSLLSWSMSFHANWGIWIVHDDSNESITDMTPLESGETRTLNISITVPNEKRVTKEGLILFTNNLDDTNMDQILISITTRYQLPPFLQHIVDFLHELLGRMPLLQRLLDINIPSMP